MGSSESCEGINCDAEYDKCICSGSAALDIHGGCVPAPVGTNFGCVADRQYVVRLFVSVPPSPEFTPADLGAGHASTAMAAMLRLCVVEALDGQVTVGQVWSERAILSGEFRETPSMLDNSVVVALITADVDLRFCVGSTGIVSAVEGQFGPKFINAASGFAMLQLGTVQFTDLIIPTSTTSTTTTDSAPLSTPSPGQRQQSSLATTPGEESDGIEKWLWLFPVLLGVPAFGCLFAVFFRLLWVRHLRERWGKWRGHAKPAGPVSAWDEPAESNAGGATAEPPVEEVVDVEEEAAKSAYKPPEAAPPEAAPPPISQETEASLSAKSIKALKALAKAHAVSIDGCVEKREIVERLLALVNPQPAADSTPLRSEADAQAQVETLRNQPVGEDGGAAYASAAAARSPSEKVGANLSRKPAPLASPPSFGEDTGPPVPSTPAFPAVPGTPAFLSVPNTPAFKEGVRSQSKTSVHSTPSFSEDFKERPEASKKLQQSPSFSELPGDGDLVKSPSVAELQPPDLVTSPSVAELQPADLVTSPSFSEMQPEMPCSGSAEGQILQKSPSFGDDDPASPSGHILQKSPSFGDDDPASPSMALALGASLERAPSFGD